MPDIVRRGSAVWKGNMRRGKGSIATESGALGNVAYSFASRFENEPGTNPEELIAAAHAACFTMAFSGALAKKGYEPTSIETHAACVLQPKAGGGFKITKMRLQTRGEVPGIDDATFKEIAREAEKGCPVSTLLRPGLEIELDAALG